MGRVKEWAEETGSLDAYWDEVDQLPPEYKQDTDNLDWWEPEEWDERSTEQTKSAVS